MPEDELIAVKCTNSNCTDKGWIRPSFSPYRAPVLVIYKKIEELYILIDYYLLGK